MRWQCSPDPLAGFGEGKGRRDRIPPILVTNRHIRYRLTISLSFQLKS